MKNGNGDILELGFRDWITILGIAATPLVTLGGYTFHRSNEIESRLVELETMFRIMPQERQNVTTKLSVDIADLRTDVRELRVILNEMQKTHLHPKAKP